MKFGIATYSFRPDDIVPLAELKKCESVHPHDEGKKRAPVHTVARKMYDMWTAITAQQIGRGRFSMGVGVGWWKGSPTTWACPSSCARNATTSRCGCCPSCCRIIQRRGLAFDLDTVADWRAVTASLPRPSGSPAAGWPPP